MNRLSQSKSPYLLQHANNPVHWYPWGDEAFERARRENKPVLVSIGYSACHWCHVMAHESFENETVAGLMNSFFVNIKVDREERPDVDAVYMEAVQMMSGQGGWPLNVFLTPDRRPFFGGTYWPPAPRHGMTSWTQVLQSIAVAWRDRREQVAQSAGQIVEQLSRSPRRIEDGPLSSDLLTQGFNSIAAEFDEQNAGFGGAPKFPQPLAIEFVLRYSQGDKDSEALRIAQKTLEAMAAGGMYDQLGGGFHRYSVDERWLVPHFEKMLYDNALLARIYTQAWQATGNDAFRQIASEILDYVLRDMTSPEGAFYSSEDADSEGEEGKFYVWAYGDLESLLTPKELETVKRVYGVTREGNFEGTNILVRTGHLRSGFQMPQEDPDVDVKQLKTARRKLLEQRSARVRPHRDEKILTDWNALMLGAFALAGAAFGRADYIEVTRRSASFLLKNHLVDGRLAHTAGAVNQPIAGFLEDYVYLIEALVTLFEATGEDEWITRALELTQTFLTEFDDPEGGFFQTGESAVDELPSRPKSLFDGALPSGNSSAAMSLLRLGSVTGESQYEEKAKECIELVAPVAARHGTSFGYALCALGSYLSPAMELVLTQAKGDEGDVLTETFRKAYLPNALKIQTAEDAIASSQLAVLEGKHTIDGRSTVYVCQNFTCRVPVTDEIGFRQQLEPLRRV